MMIRKIDTRVVDNPTTLKKNEWLATKDAMRSKPNRYHLGLDTLVLEGPGAWQMERYFGNEGIEDMLATEAGEKTLHDCLDELPLYAALHADVEIADQGWVCTLNLTFVKNVEEGDKYLAEYYCPKID